MAAKIQVARGDLVGKQSGGTKITMFNLLSKTSVNEDTGHHTINADLLIKYINNLYNLIAK